MSSRLFPCVSGTQKITKNRPARQMPPNIQNVMALPRPVIRSVKVLVTTNVQVQLNPVTIEAAEPRILAEKQIQICKNNLKIWDEELDSTTEGMTQTFIIKGKVVLVLNYALYHVGV